MSAGGGNDGGGQPPESTTLVLRIERVGDSPTEFSYEVINVRSLPDVVTADFARVISDRSGLLVEEDLGIDVVPTLDDLPGGDA